MNPMRNDEIAEVRKIRHEISEECGHDVRRVAAYYRRIEEELKESEDFRFEDQSLTPQTTAPTGDVADTK
jgi:hypothetical protein